MRYLFAVLSAALILAVSYPAAAAPAREEAVFAGGCFWCTELDLDKIPGVISTTSGFTGGKVRNPSYQQVSAGGTGHIEAVRVVYDPKKLSYDTLVRRFLRTIDPLDAGGQFCDRGQEYRSAIFVAGSAQRKIAAVAKAQAAAELKQPVETLILPAAPFYAAEESHQNYYKKNPVKYRLYRLTCGRDARVKKVWGKH